MQKALLIVGLLILLVACGESEPMATPDSNPGSTIGVSSYSYSAHAYFNSECYEYSNTIRYGCTRAYGDSNTHGDTYTSSYGYANADQHAHAYGNTYTSSYSYANADPCRTHLDFRQRDKDRARRSRSWPMDGGNFNNGQRGLRFRKL